MIASGTLIDMAAGEWVAGDEVSRTFVSVDAEELATRASEALASGDDSEALRLANDALELEHKSSLSWRILAYCLGSMGRHFDAIDCALSAVRYGSHDAINHYTHAWALRGAQKPNEALTAIDEALDINPDFPDALSMRAVLRRELGDHEGSIADMRKAKSFDGHRH
ncbi:tetratricopeptide repeat protein [Mycobacteroides sp. LB1]|uniref:tetratricopeptide repeat protein n=1 Tax=Mycobacteroides sp. LB1 TaxID=2750814 RepID=UPI0015DDCE09|nr:tetratricopeptide repeat protein [Mycobacteroides sp. LB1]